jgi:competence protein ComEA
MARSDDALRRITRERLHAVAQPGGARPERPPSGPVDGGRSGPEPAWLPSVEAGPDSRAAAWGGADRLPIVQLGPGRLRSVGVGPDGTEPVGAVAGRLGPDSSPPAEIAPDPVRPVVPDTGRTPTVPARPARHAGRHRRDPVGDADDPAVPPARDAGRDQSGAWPALPAAPSAPQVDDVRDVVERMRREALAEVAAQYSRRHGHPLEHPGVGEEGARRRWFLTVRHAVVAGVAVAVLTAGVVVRAVAEVPETVPPPDAPSVSAPAGPAESSAATATGPSGTEPPGAQPGPVRDAGGVRPSAGAATEAATPTPGPPDGVVVHVVGHVHAPGLVQLPAGSRVGDALGAAGGATDAADLSVVNLARVLVDGEQIVVPAPGDAPRSVAGPGGGAPTGGAPAGAGVPVVVDLNVAGLAELDGLPGIGPVIAQRILDWRADNGPFRDVEELGEVAGIGETLLGRLRPLVVV